MSNSLTDLMCLDIYLSSLNDKEYQSIKKELETAEPKMMPLLSWDIFMDGNHRYTSALKRKQDLFSIKNLAKEYQWNNNIENLFESMDYEAIIVTDKDQKIIWVNDGFSEMTGYSTQFAIKKTPRFLQGNQTKEATKNRIRFKIKQHKPFSEVIVNHRKDGTTYKCKVNIIPLYHNQTTHYIAFEKQIA